MINQPKQYTYEQLFVGQKAVFDFTISQEMISIFAENSGDTNPLHTDYDYASKTEYKRPIAHGMISGMLFSRLIGMELPGLYSVYLSQNLNFRKPIYAGDEVSVSGEIIQKIDAFKTLIISTKIINKISGELLIDGQAMVKILK